MARKKIKTKEPQIITTPVLDELELVKGSPVRFRHDESQNWTKGKILGDNRDGSLTILDACGKMRAVMPENVQLRKTGPRGGNAWEPIK